MVTVCDEDYSVMKWIRMCIFFVIVYFKQKRKGLNQVLPANVFFGSFRIHYLSVVNFSCECWFFSYLAFVGHFYFVPDIDLLGINTTTGIHFILIFTISWVNMCARTSCWYTFVNEQEVRLLENKRKKREEYKTTKICRTWHFGLFDDDEYLNVILKQRKWWWWRCP